MQETYKYYYVTFSSSFWSFGCSPLESSEGRLRITEYIFKCPECLRLEMILNWVTVPKTNDQLFVIDIQSVKTKFQYWRNDMFMMRSFYLILFLSSFKVHNKCLEHHRQLGTGSFNFIILGLFHYCKI